VSNSSIPTLKNALHDALLALQSSTLAGVQVAYGFPGPNPQAEFIWLGDVNPSEQAPVFLGRQSRNEDYTLEIYVRVRQTRRDQQTVTERAFTIAGVIETLLRSDPTVGSVVREALITSMGLAELVSDDLLDRMAIVTVLVNVTNRI